MVLAGCSVLRRYLGMENGREHPLVKVRSGKGNEADRTSRRYVGGFGPKRPSLFLDGVPPRSIPLSVCLRMAYKTTAIVSR